jgi:hypothetical protein
VAVLTCRLFDFAVYWFSTVPAAMQHVKKEIKK